MLRLLPAVLPITGMIMVTMFVGRSLLAQFQPSGKCCQS